MNIKNFPSRINKYRAWDIRKSEMVYDALELSETGQLVTVNAPYFNSPFSFFNGCIWMQHTTLFDKNKKDIYEGDLCLRNGHLRVVVFIEGSFMVIPIFNNNIDIDHIIAIHEGWHLCNFISDIEVIGNVFENKSGVKASINVSNKDFSIEIQNEKLKEETK